MKRYLFRRIGLFFTLIFLGTGCFFLRSKNITVELLFSEKDAQLFVKKELPLTITHFVDANIKAVIFDMDGTIFKSENVWGAVTEDYVAEALGRELTSEELIFIRSLSGRANSVVAEHLKEHFKFEASVKTIASAMLDEGVKRTIEATEYIEGFEQFIKQLLEHNIPVALATNADIKILDAYNQKMKIDQYFGEHMYSFEHSEQKTKPDPAVFLLAAKKLGFKPEECLVFEDSHPGFLAAQKAGMRCIAIENERNVPHRHLVHATIPHFHEVSHGVKKLIPSEK